MILKYTSPNCNKKRMQSVGLGTLTMNISYHLITTNCGVTFAAIYDEVTGNHTLN